MILISLPSTQPEILTKLLPDNVCAQSASNGSRCEAAAAVGELAWSPDGNYLAFTGAQDGISSDLYVYSTLDNTIKHLTNGPTQAIDPMWSPDGSYIVSAGAIRMNAGAGDSTGPTIDAEWAVRRDGSDLHIIYQSGATEPYRLGWLDNRVFLQYHDEMGCDTYDIETINIKAPQNNEITGLFASAAFDPSSGNLLVTIPDEANPYCPIDRKPGVYLFSLHQSMTPKLIDLGNKGLAEILDESPQAGLFFIQTDSGVDAVDLQGNDIALDYPSFTRAPSTIVAADGRTWAIFASQPFPGEDGLWIGSLHGKTKSIWSDGMVNDVLWAPDSSYLLFSAFPSTSNYQDSYIYQAVSPPFQPVELVGPFEDGAFKISWVMP